MSDNKESVRPECEHYVDKTCLVVEGITGQKVQPPIDSCVHCIQQPDPRNANRVTCGLSTWVMRNHGMQVPDSVRLCALGRTSAHVVGTELRKLISWFVWNKKASSCKKCVNREHKMNMWGPEGCEEMMDTILGWLKESAEEHGYPFSKRLVTLVVKRAIKNARNKMGGSSNNST